MSGMKRIVVILITIHYRKMRKVWKGMKVAKLHSHSCGGV
jgi:hypothetical protein